MKTEKNILIAFILNLSFSIFEFIGGAITGSVAIMSDAVHDMGDAVSIGISWVMEKMSKKQPNEVYTYGYGRYSVIGSIITNLVLIIGSVVVVYNSVIRLFNPVAVNYMGMIGFAVIGVAVNLIAAFVTREGDSLNQKAVNLHMLEDVLGWAVVLIGSVVMYFTDFAYLDSLMSIGVSVFILVNAVKNLLSAHNLFLEKIPDGLKVENIRQHLCEIEGVIDVHHIHIWSMDGYSNYATMHIVTNADSHGIKEKVREELKEHKIGHVTLELENYEEHCHNQECHVHIDGDVHHHHHHHH